jgi:hypothetical protein
MAHMVPILAAAAKRRRDEEQEEVAMTRYSTEELNDDWEFKIVRSLSPVFHKPGKLQALIEQEARAGWVMLEKLDNQRIRFKRPRQTRVQDAYLPPGVDPYSTQYGTSMGTQVGVGFIVLGFVLALAIGLVAGLGGESGMILPPIILGTIVLIGLAVVAIAARNRAG